MPHQNNGARRPQTARIPRAHKGLQHKGRHGRPSRRPPQRGLRGAPSPACLAKPGVARAMGLQRESAVSLSPAAGPPAGRAAARKGRRRLVVQDAKVLTVVCKGRGKPLARWVTRESEESPLFGMQRRNVAAAGAGLDARSRCPHPLALGRHQDGINASRDALKGVRGGPESSPARCARYYRAHLVQIFIATEPTNYNVNR